jgi:outer membrane protein OmpA-like peptidoglycan-associated protein/ABC-type nitrate/sulfonate/bicarbonate transport system substrate-binding protein
MEEQRSTPVRRTIIFSITLAMAIGAPCFAQQSFRDLVGPVTVGEVKESRTYSLPFLTWGGDIPTFFANGGLKTAKGSIFDRQGLSFDLVNGDNFIQQVKDYMAGKTPFLRGTFGMIGMASEVIGSDPRTKGVVVFQLTWSAGDHCIARQEIKTIADLKGKKVVLQRGGPHVELLDSILSTANLTWKDVEVVWADDLSGAKGPAEMFRKDPALAACFAISPDMMGLTGGLTKIGTGAEGTVKGARVLVSTAEMSYVIADVYVVRKDFYDKHKDQLAKLAAGYLKACEEVIELKKAYEKGGSAEYKKLLQMAQGIYGKESVPTLDDAHGMICDCSLVGHPGNVAFLTDKANQHGFGPVQERVLKLAVSQGYAKVKQGFFASDLDWASDAFVGYLAKTGGKKGDRFKVEAVESEIDKLNAGALDERTILMFAVNFDVDQTVFSETAYGVEFQRVVDALGKFGNAVIVVRGHTDPTKTIYECVQAGLARGTLKRSGTEGNWQYSLAGKAFDLNSTAEITRLIEAGEFDGVADHNPREIMASALNLSRQRADSVRDAVIKFAEAKAIKIDKSQITAVGAGIREPFIAKPRNKDEAAKNRRVEFRIIRVSSEAVKDSDFNF